MDPLEALADATGVADGSRDPGTGHPSAPELPELGDERFETMVAYGADVLSVHATDGTLLYISPSVTVNLGYVADELVGRDLVDLVHPDDQDRVARAFEVQRTDAGLPTPVDYRVRHIDGTWRWFEGACRDLTDDPNVGGVLFNVRNVTDRHQAEDALRTAEAEQRALLENVSELIIVIDAAGHIQGNPTGTQVLGYPNGFGEGENILHYVHPEDSERVLAFLLDRVHQPGFTEPVEMRLRHYDGRWRHCEAMGNNLLHDPIVQGAIITVRDVTDRKQGELLLERQSGVLEMVARTEAIEDILDALARMIEEQSDDAVSALVVFDEDRMGARAVAAPSLGASWTVGENTVEALCETGWISLPGEGPRFGWVHPITAQASDHRLGAVVFCPSERRFPRVTERRAIDLAASLASVSLEREVAVEELAFRATHDPLTGLLTRTTFQEGLNVALERRTERSGHVAVLFVDLDRFKDVNDGIGHEKGDRILVTLADRLEMTLRSNDIVARFGGDEFAIVAHVEGPEHARLVADRILEEIMRPIELDGAEFVISASIGIALPSGEDVDADSLISDADIAMYRAKERGRARAEVFDTALRSGMMARLDMEAGLRRALVDNEFFLDYQPVVNLRSGDTSGIEALVRWRQPDGRLVSPGEFIPLAEETGLIVPIGRWVLEESARQAARWRELRPDDPPMVLAVNLSARQLAHPGLVAEVAAAIDMAGAEPDNLSLEITESVLLDNHEETLRVLDALRDLGVQLVIDDFGTGYSSLEYLKRLPVNVLKIDRGFVAGLGRDDEDSAIVRAVIDLSHDLGLRVVAEGVEEEIQLHELERFGCDFAQGFLLARPQAPEKIDELLARDLRPGLAAG